MADETPRHLADPDLERARAWWKGYGRSIIGGAAIALASVTGYNYWQNHQQTRAAEASELFEQLRAEIETAEEAREADAAKEDDSADSADSADSGDSADAGAKPGRTAALAARADQLMRDYASTPYAIHAAFALAKFAVESGDAARATGALEWAVANAREDALRHIARLRLAALLLAGGQADAAANLLEVGDTAAFAARYHELRGDAAFQQADPASARAHWQSGLEAMPRGDASRALLQLKLDNLGK
ncbi:MAG: tetratricopeptide repeat protein [Gammaproteobacteria bacterium]